MKFIPSRRAGAVAVIAALGAGSVTAGVATGATNLRLRSAKQGVKFSKKRLRARPGRVTIRLKVPRGSQFPHAIAIRGRGINRRGNIVASGTSRVSVRLRRGRYTFYCPVGQHAQNGMRGRLIVR